MRRHLFHVGALVLGLLAVLALGPEAGAQKRGGVLRVGLTG